MGVLVMKIKISAAVFVLSASVTGCASQYADQSELICQTMFPNVSRYLCVRAVSEDMELQAAGKQGVLPAYIRQQTLPVQTQ